MAGNLNDLHAFHFPLDGSATNYDFTCTRGWLVIDVKASTNSTVGGATSRLYRAAAATPGVYNAVTPALATDTVDDIEFAAKVDDTQSSFGAGDVMRVGTANVPLADFFVEVLPTSWVGG